MTTQPTLKAIPTLYRETTFRSRLEAKWAVFYSSLGIEWRYEPEGYDLDGTYYLPDFYLPEIGIWLEKKGTVRGQVESTLRKAMLLSLASRQTVLLFVGDVSYETGALAFFSDRDESRYDGPVYWIECPECHRLGYGDTQHCRCLFCGVQRRVASRRAMQMRTTPRLLQAYTAARSARF